MKKILFTEVQIKELENFLKSKEEYIIGVRVSLILALARGQSSRKIGDIKILSHNQIIKWANRYLNEGLEGLKDRHRSGRKPKISEEQLRWLKNLVLNETPSQYGYNTDIWTAPILVEMIEKYCNIKYSDDMVYILLKKNLD
ncbi:MAG: hypothetical protein BWX61_00492 [Bacteroidetes bacterium ADurb.Bin035]|jgi:transposase|nr:MAG: hypothetical protein BWX61_00492 [Bacteroidetes bacterium ADurb.Bin035]